MIPLQTVLKNRYRIIHLLNEGGMAYIYEAEDLYLKKQIAVKVLKPHLVQDPKAKKRFYQEFKITAGLKSPMILQVYDYFEEKKYHCLVMELFVGQTLKEVIDSYISFSWEEAIQIIKPLLKAVAFLYENNIVHCDLSTSNIFITFDRQVKIGDFGIALYTKHIDFKDNFKEKKATHINIVGNPKYMAPEMVYEQYASHQSDLYALGIIFYEMLTGKTPFQNYNRKLLAYKHISEVPIDINKLNKAVSVGVNNIIAKLLAKNIFARYQTVKEVQADLCHLEKEPFMLHKMKAINNKVLIYKKNHFVKVSLRYSYRFFPLLIKQWIVILFFIFGLITILTFFLLSFWI